LHVLAVKTVLVQCSLDKNVCEWLSMGQLLCAQDGSDAARADRSRKQDVLKELQLLHVK